MDVNIELSKEEIEHFQKTNAVVHTIKCIKFGEEDFIHLDIAIKKLEG